MTEILTPLTELDTDALLAVNGWKHVWADQFMYAYSGKWVWVPFYASILYVLFKNYNWKYVIGCLFAIGLTIAFADQIGASVIRPLVERLRPSNPANPISHMVEVVNGYRGGRYGFPSCHAANTAGLAFFLLFCGKTASSAYSFQPGLCLPATRVRIWASIIRATSLPASCSASFRPPFSTPYLKGYSTTTATRK